MRLVTVFSILLLSAFFIPASASDQQPPKAQPASPLQPLRGAVTPDFRIADGFELEADPIHTAGWHRPGAGGEGADDTEQASVDEALADETLADETLADEAVETRIVVTAANKAEVICEAIASAAQTHDLPVLFFARLIWQESRFKPDAVSRAGAQGVAQFMPRVAAEMGLEDPFDPVQALPVSARLLSQLYERFGNWGLAAAAYNGGPRRVREWLSRKGGLPRETRHYVKTITGVTAERWAGTAPLSVEFERPSRLPCDNLPQTELHARESVVPMPPSRQDDSEIVEASAVAKVPGTKTEAKSGDNAWAVQLAAHWSGKQALAIFRRLRDKHPAILGEHKPVVASGSSAGKKSGRRQRVQIAVSTRAEANSLCARLKAAGSTCLVRRN